MIFMTERTYGLIKNDINKRLISDLGQRGDSLILFPEIETTAVGADNVLDLSGFGLSGFGLSGFGWIIFPDLHCVDFFLDRITEKFTLDDLRVCAFGEAVADKLRFAQLHADVIPAKIDSEGVFSAIAAYASPQGLNILLPKKESANLPLAELLTAAGAQVFAMPVYRIRESPETTRLRSLLIGGAVDEFIFNSPQDVFELANYADPGTLKITFSSSNEPASQTLREFQLSAAIRK
jgi:uroporphyrinogen-III synthase